MKRTTVNIDGEGKREIHWVTKKKDLVIGESDVGPIDALAPVLVLLHLEDVLVEVALDGLVGEVDEELLEAVDIEDFESIDVLPSAKHSCFPLRH